MSTAPLCSWAPTLSKELETMQIEKILTTTPKEKPAADTLGFGKYFTDHMFIDRKSVV